MVAYHLKTLHDIYSGIKFVDLSNSNLSYKFIFTKFRTKIGISIFCVVFIIAITMYIRNIKDSFIQISIIIIAFVPCIDMIVYIYIPFLSSNHKIHNG